MANKAYLVPTILWRATLMQMPFELKGRFSCETAAHLEFVYHKELILNLAQCENRVLSTHFYVGLVGGILHAAVRDC